MKTQPKILIVGTGSLLNYGCEAIIHGTHAMFRQYWPESILTVASDDLEYDRELFKDYVNIEFIPYKKRFTLYRLIKGILRRIGIGDGSPVRMNTNISKSYDIFLSAGGDNYAEAPDGKLYHILIDLMKMGNNAFKHKALFILWGASVGPFSKENTLKIIENLNVANVIYLREEISLNYLRNFINDDSKLKLVADPAFWMEAKKIENSFRVNKSDVVIGLNISQLSVNHAFRDKTEGEEILFKSLDSVLEKYQNYKYVCIPHVISEPEGAQNDLLFMNKYLTFSKYKNRISILPFGIGARITKGYIQNCDVLIAARMHCCVAGVSSSVPTLFLTYSMKGEGMAKYVYGHLNYTLKMQEFSDVQLSSKLDKMLIEKDEITSFLKNQQIRFREDSSKAIKSLKEYYLHKNQ